MISNTDTKPTAVPPKGSTAALSLSSIKKSGDTKGTDCVTEKKADGADSSNDAMETVGNNLSGKVPSFPNTAGEQGEGDESNVFVDADFHVLYKEYNLRRSKAFLTTVQPPSKDLKSEPENKELPEKRPRSLEDLGEQAAKKLKISEDATQPENREPEESVTAAEAELKSKAKTSPAKSGRARKTSLSQSKRSYKKKQVPDASGTESGPNRLCGLCARKGSINNLGFLYGPYKPVADNRDNEEGKKEEEKMEVEDVSLWVHEDCAVWAPGVCVVKGKLLGLHEAVTDSKKLVGILIMTAGTSASIASHSTYFFYQKNEFFFVG